MEEALVRVVDRYGFGVALFLVIVLSIRAFFASVAPELVKIYVAKVQAEIETIRETQKAVSTSIPSAIADLKTALVAVEGRIVDAIKNQLDDKDSAEIKTKLGEIEKNARRGSIPDADVIPAPPPSRSR